MNVQSSACLVLEPSLPPIRPDDLEDFSIEQRIPEEVRLCLAVLKADSRQVLTIAAVIGREFSLQLLERIVPAEAFGVEQPAPDQLRSRLVELLRDAVTAGIVAPMGEGCGAYRFASECLSSTLADALRPDARVAILSRIDDILAAWAPRPMHFPLLTRRRILLVENNEDITRVVCRSLRGYRVAVSSTGFAALQALRLDPLLGDLILIDLGLPDGDGTAIIESLRDAGVRSPIVVLAGPSSDGDILRSYTAGADCYLTKPFRMPTLRRIVDFFIGDLSTEEAAAIEATL